MHSSYKIFTLCNCYRDTLFLIYCLNVVAFDCHCVAPFQINFRDKTCQYFKRLLMISSCLFCLLCEFQSYTVAELKQQFHVQLKIVFTLRQKQIVMIPQ